MTPRASHLLAPAILLGLLPLLDAGVQAASQDNAGFLYGRVTARGGNAYTGFLRWGTEEAFWDDLFQSAKDELPYRREVRADELDREDRRHRGEIELLGGVIRWETDADEIAKDASRIFAARFGDIAFIEPHGDDRANVHMKSGSVIEVGIDVPWDRIEKIEFAPAQPQADPGVFRLYGKVETDAGPFEGFIQWDEEECVSSDKLDGDTEDGRIAIEMGAIRSLARHGFSSCQVELKDGRAYRLDGTNDVNDDNRGIMVEDARYGRVTIPWSEFDRVTFSDHGSSGKGYADYAPLGTLTGEVKTQGGETHRGRLVYDLDETEGWEMLNGNLEDLEFNIPFADVRSIAPSHDESGVALRNGEQLRLEDAQDVSEKCDGVLIYSGAGAQPVYVRWDQVAEVRFE
jgi:hypothetical protein